MTGQPDLKDLWRDQPTETPPMTLAQIHARGFQDRVRRRNVIEYVACAIVAAVFGFYVVWLPDPFLKLSCGLIALGAAFVGWQLHRRASARPTPSANALDFHRAELVRQHAALGSAWAWYLAPFAPGLAIFMVRSLIIMPPDTPVMARMMLPLLTALYGVAWFIINARGRKRLRAQIAELDALRGS